MTDFNLFEPSLDITTPYLPYEDLGIQGVWPRNHKIPADIFPTFAHIGGTNVEKTKVHSASFTDDRRLRVDTGSGGGGATQTVAVPQTYYAKPTGTGFFSTGTAKANASDFWFDDTLKALTSVQLFIVVTAVLPGTNLAIVEVDLTNHSELEQVNLCYIDVGIGGVVWGDGRYSIIIPFNPPLDIASTFTDGQAPLVFFFTANCSAYMSIRPLGYV